MQIDGLDHFTLRIPPEALALLRRFYVDVIGLHEGPRAAFDFPGHWLYAGDRAVVHLAGNAPAGEGAAVTVKPTGHFDHIAFRVQGLAAARERLLAHGVEWREVPVPGMPLHQLFLRDPAGVRIELNFDAAEPTRAAHASS